MTEIKIGIYSWHQSQYYLTILHTNIINLCFNSDNADNDFRGYLKFTLTFHLLIWKKVCSLIMKDPGKAQEN